MPRRRTPPASFAPIPSWAAQGILWIGAGFLLVRIGVAVIVGVGIVPDSIAVGVAPLLWIAREGVPGNRSGIGDTVAVPVLLVAIGRAVVVTVVGLAVGIEIGVQVVADAVGVSVGPVFLRFR